MIPHSFPSLLAHNHSPVIMIKFHHIKNIYTTIKLTLFFLQPLGCWLSNIIIWLPVYCNIFCWCFLNQSNLAILQVCDFGLSRLKANTFLSSKTAAGTVSFESFFFCFICFILVNQIHVVKCFCVLYSLSGWHQKFYVMSHQMRSLMFTALVLSYGSS